MDGSKAKPALAASVRRRAAGLESADESSSGKKSSASAHETTGARCHGCRVHAAFSLLAVTLSGSCGSGGEFQGVMLHSLGCGVVDSRQACVALECEFTYLPSASAENSTPQLTMRLKRNPGGQKGANCWPFTQGKKLALAVDTTPVATIEAQPCGCLHK